MMRLLRCCICDNEAYGEQWWNRDKGFGICNSCVARYKPGMDEEEFKSCYGVEGKHYNILNDSEIEEWKKKSLEIFV